MVMLPATNDGGGVEEILIFDDLEEGLMGVCNDQDSHAVEKLMSSVADNWLFAGATVVEGSELRSDWADRLWKLRVTCSHSCMKFASGDHKFSESGKQNKLKIESCTASVVVAKFALMHYAGMDLFTNAWHISPMLGTFLPDALDTFPEDEFFVDVSTHKDLFMAYCITFRQLGFFDSTTTFNWPAKVDNADRIGYWQMDTVEQAFIYGSQIKGENGIYNDDNVNAVKALYEAATGASMERELAAATESANLNQVDLKLSKEQLQQTVPAYIRDSMLGLPVLTLSELLALPPDKQAKEFALSEAHRTAALNKGFQNIDNFGEQLVVTSVITTMNRTIVLAVDKGKPDAASIDRLGGLVDDHRIAVGEVLSYSTFLLDGHMNKVLACPMKVASRSVSNYNTFFSELVGEKYGQDSKCFAAAVVQLSKEMAQGGIDTRQHDPHILKYEVHAADEFSSKMLTNKGFAVEDYMQIDGTVRCISFVPLSLFKNWYIIDPQNEGVLFPHTGKNVNKHKKTARLAIMLLHS